ncbi:efflux RND transporter periplasmic adaptor subunit [Aeromonas tecta]|uniref:efflux RND transporter periplasmic adaptor subunit n=1 Tax=Aeromonas tecta TaxID=324617 RepID=UPI0009F9EB7C|nr:efflux RND transporter periplasmic adaptor subunit [Aeromonas tecta]
MKHRHFPLSSMCVVILGALLSGCGKDPVPDKAEASRPVNVITLPEHSASQTLRFSGEIRSHQRAQLAFRVAGTVDTILVKEGDKVSKGEVLARLDPHDFRVQRGEIAAMLKEAKAASRLAEVELKRTRQAVNDKAMASINLDRATSANAQAKARVQTLQQSLAKAEDALGYSELRAPFDGMIGQRFIDEHEQTAPGVPVLSLHQPKILEAVVDVPEQQIGLLKTGMAGNLNWYRQDLAVRVVSSELASLPDPLKRTHEVTFRLLDSSAELVPGKSVSVELSQPGSEQLHCLPASAVKSQGSENRVMTVRAGQAIGVPVEVVSQRHDSLCVKGQLFAGDKVVTAGSALLKERQPVHLIKQVGAQS